MSSVNRKQIGIVAVLLAVAAVEFGVLASGAGGGANAAGARASAAVGAATARPLVSGTAGGAEAHYFVFEDDGTSAVRPVYHRFVHLSAPPASLTPAQAAARLATPGRLTDSLSFQLETAGGAVVFRDVSDTPRWLRGEFAGGSPGASIDGHVLPLRTRAFVVRAPVLPGTKLRVRGGSGGDATFDADQLALNLALASSAIAGAVPAPPPPSNAANRVDMLIMGDGYTAAQAGKFAADAATLTADFFNLTPYGEYRNYVNVTTLFTPSAQSGADHPPYQPGCTAGDPSCCGDPEMQSDSLAGTFVSTAFDATYCTSNIHRLLTVNPTKVLAAAAGVPDWDEILVLVNDTTYGGSGGQGMGVLSTNAVSVNVAQHEYGHSFTRLADEYDSSFPGFPPCSDVNSALPPCERNVTDETSRALIKWGAWILGLTPLPTPSGNPLFAAAVGLFEGARYISSGMYRPGDNCLMRSLGQPFCQVASEAYVLRLYQGGWGVPAFGIDTIEPGSENPPPGTVLASMPGSVTFSVSLLQPVGGPPLDVTWSVDDVPAPGAHASSFVFTPAVPGNYAVRLDVHDTTSLVNPASPGSSSMLHSRTWLVSPACTPLSPPTVSPPLSPPSVSPPPECPPPVCPPISPPSLSPPVSPPLPPPSVSPSVSPPSVSPPPGCTASGAGAISIGAIEQPDPLTFLAAINTTSATDPYNGFQIHVKVDVTPLQDVDAIVNNIGFGSTILDANGVSSVSCTSSGLNWPMSPPPSPGVPVEEGVFICTALNGQSTTAAGHLTTISVKLKAPGNGCISLALDTYTIDAATSSSQPNAVDTSARKIGGGTSGCDAAPVDTDGDLVPDALDNCRFVANAGQLNTDAANAGVNRPGADALGDACDDDIDGDGYTNAQETALAKDPAAYCDIMRADVDGDHAVTILDLTALAGQFLAQVPPAPERYRQDADNAITILDLTKMANLFLDNVSACS